MSFLMPILVDILASLATKKMFATLLVELCGAWADHSANQYDDKVVEAMAEALGIDPKSVPKE